MGVYSMSFDTASTIAEHPETVIKLACEDCQGQWMAKASNVIGGDVPLSNATQTGN